MFRVPNDPNEPTFDYVHKITFWQWLTSSADQRKEWQRRRNAAIPTMNTTRALKRNEQRVEEKKQAKEAEKARKKQAKGGA